MTFLISLFLLFAAIQMNGKQVKGGELPGGFKLGAHALTAACLGAIPLLIALEPSFTPAAYVAVVAAWLSMRLSAVLANPHPIPATIRAGR